MKHVVSFSGGRTSAYLVHLMEQKRINDGWDVSYIFLDTGAEHPKTYEFIRNVVKYFNIDLICLKAITHFEVGKGNTYEKTTVGEIGYDLQVWKDMLKKYSTPYNPSGAFCTSRMKTTPYIKFCNDEYGKRNYIDWFGIRADEPKRLKVPNILMSYDRKFLAEISDFDKDDVLDWWEKQPFDLDLPEHLGNCVFCIKKGINKVALAAKDEPELAKQFMEVLESSDVRDITNRQSPKLSMYRGKMSLREVIKAYEGAGRDELFNTLRYSKRFDTGSCSESCEIFNEDSQLDLLEEDL